MRMREEFDAALYLTSRATTPLAEVASALADGLGMPAFELEGQDSWDCAQSERPGLGLNLTRGRRPGAVDDLLAGTPAGSTYHIIVYTKGRETTVEDVRQVLLQRCGMETELIKGLNLNRATDAAPWGGTGLGEDAPVEDDEEWQPLEPDDDGSG